MVHATTEFDNAATEAVVDDIREHRRAFLAIGVLSILTGAAAILAPRIAGFAVELFTGVALAVGGAAAFFLAFQARRRRGVAGVVIAGLLSLVTGLLLMAFPIGGIIALTLVLAAYLIAGGVVKAYFAWRARPSPAWGWLMASGVTSALLGVLVVSGVPGHAAWILGLIVGIDLMFHGAFLTALSLAAKKRA